MGEIKVGFFQSLELVRKQALEEGRREVWKVVEEELKKSNDPDVTMVLYPKIKARLKL